MNHASRLAAASVSVLGLAVASANAQSLYLFQPAPGYTSAIVTGLSDDGTRVSGYYANQNGSTSAFWGDTSGQIDHFGGVVSPYALGISGDGNVVVGFTRAFDQGNGRAYRYNTSTRELQNMGTFPRMTITTARAANRDGSMVVGNGYDRNNVSVAYRWREGVGYTSLNIGLSEAPAVSGDGNVVVVNLASRVGGAFVWNADGSLRALGLPQDGRDWYSTASSTNHDGSIVVGVASTGDINGDSQAAVWRHGQIELLGSLGNSMIATHTNNDGSIIAGEYYDGNASTGTMWTAAHGLETADAYFARFGLTLDPGWRFSRIYDMSADGMTITGAISNRSLNIGRSYVVTVPAPASLAVWLLAMAAVPRRQSACHADAIAAS